VQNHEKKFVLSLDFHRNIWYDTKAVLQQAVKFIARGGMQNG
jgi:hypothetical protein